MTDTMAPPPNVSDKLFHNLMETYILPAVRLRKSRGELPKPVSLRAAQVLWFPDGRTLQVRVNDEVKGIAGVRLKDGIRKKKGEAILESDVEGIQSLKLLDDDGDCGHATMFRLPGRWSIVFAFSYNRMVGRRHLDAAQEFLATAKECHATDRPIALVDNLFSACELAAKATLLSMPDPALYGKTGHHLIHSKLNLWASQGSVAPAHRKAFNRLFRLRSEVRYLKKSERLTDGEAVQLLAAVEEMTANAASRHT